LVLDQTEVKYGLTDRLTTLFHYTISAVNILRADFA